MNKKVKSLGYLTLSVEKNKEFENAVVMYNQVKEELYNTLSKKI